MGKNLKDVLEFTGKALDFDKWFETFEDYEAYVRKDGMRFKIFYNNDCIGMTWPSDYIVKKPTGGRSAVNFLQFEQDYEACDVGD